MYRRILVASFCIAVVILKSCFSVEISTDNEVIGATNTISSEKLPVVSGYAKVKVFKKLLVPRGSSITLTAQVSKPKILPGFFFKDDGIILDAVIELPIWLDLDRFVDAMYNNPQDTTTEGEKRNSIAGKERCLIYKELEIYIASLLPIPQSLPRSCLLRAICETQSIVKFYESQPHSLLVEMLTLLLSPSYEAQDGCNSPYLEAEKMGKHGQCMMYSSDCPINIMSLLMSHSFRQII